MRFEVKLLSLVLICTACASIFFLQSVVISLDRMEASSTMPNPRTVPKLRRDIPTPEKRMKVAVAITVTKDGPYLDGAAVLAHSVIMSKSKYDIEFVAIVHPGVVTTRPALSQLGFKIMEFEQPIFSKEIEGEYLRKEIDKSGCCGATELLKLRAYELDMYDRVLFARYGYDHRTKYRPYPWPISANRSLVYTYDHAMDGAVRAHHLFRVVFCSSGHRSVCLKSLSQS